MTHSAMHLDQFDQHGRFNIAQPAPGALPTVVVTTDFATVRHKVTAFRVTDGALTATLVSDGSDMTWLAARDGDTAPVDDNLVLAHRFGVRL